jgi:hypothetical protein
MIDLYLLNRFLDNVQNLVALTIASFLLASLSGISFALFVIAGYAYLPLLYPGDLGKSGVS